MRIRIGSVLIFINLLTILLVLAIIYSSEWPRIILGFPFVLFFPGYTLMLVLFPRKGKMEGVERLALSFGLSIAIVPLIGLVFNYTPWGITLDSMLYALASFVLVMSVAGWVRTRKMPGDEKPRIELHFRRPALGTSVWDKTLSVILIVAVLGAIGTAGYLISKPKAGDTFTEFYLLGQEGKLADYPKELAIGETGRVTVGIVNHERKQVSYRVKVLMGGQESEETGPTLLGVGEKWEGQVSFVPKLAGDNQEVEFLLFKGDEIEPTSSLHIWINVKG